MNVTQYTFLSPYSSPVQVGKPDSSSKDDSSTEQSSAGLDLNQTLDSAKNFQATQVGEVKIEVESDHLLDTYA